MSKSEIIRAWKDPAFRSRLGRERLAEIVPNPAGLVELSDEQLKGASGLGGFPQTTVEYCTNPTFRGMRACCP